MEQLNNRFSNPYAKSQARSHIFSDIEQQKYKQQVLFPSQQIIVSEGLQSHRSLHNPEKSKLTFEGHAFQFQLFLREKRRDELLAVIEADINLIGIEVRSVNKCVPFCCGFLFAYIYCFCNCLFCCRCRQKIIYTLYEVHQLGYENIVRLLQACPNLIVLKLKVNDNNLNQAKASVLAEALKIGNAKRFELINEALGISIEPDKSFEDFAFNFKKLKQLRIESTIKWQDVVVI